MPVKIVPSRPSTNPAVASPRPVRRPSDRDIATIAAPPKISAMIPNPGMQHKMPNTSEDTASALTRVERGSESYGEGWS
jgi:hypothetical protein